MIILINDIFTVLEVNLNGTCLCKFSMMLRCLYAFFKVFGVVLVFCQAVARVLLSGC